MQASRWPYVLLGAAIGAGCTILLVGCGGGVIYLFTRDSAPEESFDWCEVSSREHGFRVLMPAAAMPVQTETKTTGGTIRVSTYTVYTSPGDRRRIFQVVCRHYPARVVSIEGSSAKALIGTQNELIANLHGAMKAHNPQLSRSKYDEVSCIFESPGFGEVQCRILLSGDKLYEVIAIRGSQLPDRGEARRFLESFELLEPQRP